MDADQPREHRSYLVSTEQMENSILELRLSLTAVYAYAQLLERRSRNGTPSTPQQVDIAAGAISAACEDMIATFHELERYSTRPA